MKEKIANLYKSDLKSLSGSVSEEKTINESYMKVQKARFYKSKKDIIC